MATPEANQGSNVVQDWPEESREAAQLVLEAYGEPDEATGSQLVWHRRGPWKRIIASKAFHRHDFPAPHTDSVECVIDYRVPPEKAGAVTEFDGSVTIERTAGEVSARCHDEQANFLALNLVHDIVTGRKDVRDAREYYAQEFLDFRRRQPTPYMEGLRFSPADPGPDPGSDPGSNLGSNPASADPDVRMLSDLDLSQAVREGQGRP